MFKKEKTVIFGVSDPKSVRFEQTAIWALVAGDVKILATWGGNGKIAYISPPPILEGYGGEISGYFPPILEGPGGEISFISPPHG